METFTTTPSKPIRWRGAALAIITFLCALLFAYAALTKLWDYDKFVVQLGQSPLLTEYAGFVAWFIPAIELIIALMLRIPRTQRLGLYGFMTLMILFTAYIVAILNFAEYIPCSCGGILENLGWWEHLIFNLAFIGIAIAGITLLEQKHEHMDN